MTDNNLTPQMTVPMVCIDCINLASNKGVYYCGIKHNIPSNCVIDIPDWNSLTVEDELPCVECVYLKRQQRRDNAQEDDNLAPQIESLAKYILESGVSPLEIAILRKYEDWLNSLTAEDEPKCVYCEGTGKTLGGFTCLSCGGLGTPPQEE